MSVLFKADDPFTITIEVVPPEGNDPQPLLDKLLSISHLPLDGFSVATNPVAKPKMSAMVFAHLIQKKIKKPAILHFTVRDHNRLGLQSELWGAKALGIDTIIGVTGDPSANAPDNPTTTVNDLSVFELIEMAETSGLHAGAVLDFRPETNGLSHEAGRLEKKTAAGCRFIVTQPVYDEETAQNILAATRHLDVPMVLGILPLISYRHAVFLHDKVAGIAVPKTLQKDMETSGDPVETGIRHAVQMLALARKHFAGACIMPPFNRFDILAAILQTP